MSLALQRLLITGLYESGQIALFHTTLVTMWKIKEFRLHSRVPEAQTVNARSTRDSHFRHFCVCVPGRFVCGSVDGSLGVGEHQAVTGCDRL